MIISPRKKKDFYLLSHQIMTHVVSWLQKENSFLSDIAPFFSLSHQTVPWSVDISFVTLLEIKKNNHLYRQKNTPTDVLSFPAPVIFQQNGHLGEIMICWSVLKKQATFFHHSLEEEMTLLLIHGFLHLLGFDHEKSLADAHHMSFWEEKILSFLSFPKEKIGLILRTEKR